METFQQLRRCRTTLARPRNESSQVKYNKCDEQFDIGLASAIFAMDSLVCAPQFY